MFDLPRGTVHGGGLVIPKSIFGGGADKSLTDVPSTGDAQGFALQSTLATIRKETSESPEHKKKYQFLPEEPMISERPNTNQVGIHSVNFSVQPKPLFWFRSNTETETRIGRYFRSLL